MAASKSKPASSKTAAKPKAATSAKPKTAAKPKAATSAKPKTAAKPKAAAVKPAAKPVARSAAPKPKKVVARPVISVEMRLQMIAEAAYYRAEKRGFHPGYEHDDWLAAEADITRLIGA